MNFTELKNFCLNEEKKSFSGWDFSYINERTIEEPLPWSYDQIVRSCLSPEQKLLDMGTGGGEYLLSLKHPYANTCATEAYPPNYELCKNTLVPLGIDVRQVFDDGALPFEAGMFDIILNRHESYSADEVFRLLKPGGLFITQQVGGLNNKELGRFLLGDFKQIIDPEHNLKKNIALFSSQGFTIIKAEEFFPKLKFLDIGALVYFAKIIEWEFPGFSVDSCFEKLCNLQAVLERSGYIESMEHRFLIAAQKPIN